MNQQSTAQATIPSHSTDQTCPVDLQKPNRQAFYRDVVLNAQGQAIDESVWKPVVGEVSGRALAGKLRRNGMQIVHLFDKQGFDAAKTVYRSCARQAKITERDSLIISAFQKAGVPNEPHIERALKDLLPILEGTSSSRAAVILKNVVKTVVNGAGLKTEVPETPSTDNEKTAD
jgi:hypothetical protein